MTELGMPGIAGLDEFLSGLPLDELGEPPKKGGGDEAPEAALLLKRHNDGVDEYFIHCSLPHSPPLEEDYVPKSQTFVFPRLTLPQLCKKIEDVLFNVEIHYHRNPPVPPGLGHTSVLYALVSRQEDTQSIHLFNAAYRMLLILSQS